MSTSIAQAAPGERISRLQLLEALALRRKARSSLLEWCRILGYEPAAHQRLLIDALEMVARGEIENLMVFMPPGSAKSTYVSVCFASWCMQFDWNIIAASHTTGLAKKWGRRVRNVIMEHGPKLDIFLDQSNRAADRWSLVSGHEYLSAGVGVGIAGFRANLAIIDDPLKNRADADSETIRDKQWDWYHDDLGTRTVPGARKIVIQTRWHEDDLSGRIIEHEGEDWHILSLPAQAEENDPLGREPGEFLWGDDDYGYGDHLRKQKKRALPRTWSALYQQRPAPAEGLFFRKEWLVPYRPDEVPPRAEMQIYGGSDYAVSEDKGDYTVHVVVGVDSEDNLWLLDLWRKQATSDVWVSEFCRLVRLWKPLGWAEETGQIKSGVGPFLKEQMRKKKAFVHREAFPTRHDKAIRAQSIRGRMAMTSLRVPTHADWYEAFEYELLTFNAGKHDDQVDALGLVGQLIDKMVAGRSEEEKPEPRPLLGIEALHIDRLWEEHERELNEGNWT